MLDKIKQVRAAAAMLKPEEVLHRAMRPMRIGLIAADDSAYSQMEEFLRPDLPAGDSRKALGGQVFRPGDPNAPDTVDLVLYQRGIIHTGEAYTFDPDNPAATISAVLESNEDLSLPLARQFPAFRQAVVDSIIHAVALENALFAIATALPNVVPNLFELPWALGEFASDTAFLTINQVRMAFVIATACGKAPGLRQQMGEVMSIVGGAFGWRAIARELCGKIPLGGGLIPKGAIAYAGTYVVGKSLSLLHHANVQIKPDQHAEAWRDAMGRGRQEAEGLIAQHQERP